MDATARTIQGGDNMTNEEAINILRRIDPPRTSKKHFDDFIQARDMAINSLSQPDSCWIPVTERLPDNSRNVLITSRGGVSMAWYNGSYFEKGANTHHRKMQTVTAWCELPEPYKGVTK